VSFGVPPAPLNVAGSKAEQNKLLMQLGAERSVEEGHLSIKDYDKVKRNIDHYNQCTAKVEPLTGDLRRINTWVWGPAGCGKTSDIIGRPDIPEGMQREKAYYDKDKSKYWNGYRDNTCPVVIDDVEKDDQYMLRLLKQIA